MEKKLLLGVVVVCLCSSAALALDPMGPPAAGLAKGQLSAGAEYSYSVMDLRLINGSISGLAPLSPINITDVIANKAYAIIGYGINDKWEAFLRLGMAEGEGQGKYYGVKAKVDSDSAFAIGCGTRATFYQASPDLKWGGLAQVSWTRPEGKLKISDYSCSAEAELIEAQFALGPTYKVTEGVSIYGGPFVHFADGELGCHVGSANFSYDFEEQVNFGGYIGGQVDVTENCFCNVEWMHNDQADGVAIGIIVKF